MQLIHSPPGAAPVSPGVINFPLQDFDGAFVGNEELRYRLINVLQSTLDLDELLTLFVDCGRKFIDFDSVRFHGENSSVDITLGNVRAHQCNYRLITQQETLGEITFSRRSRFNADEIEQFEIALSALAYPLRNALRYQSAIKTALIDPLTATGNRIALDNALHRELQLANRYQQSLSLLMIDIDHFKQINDTYGHQVGDDVLRAVADAIKTITRETDMIFRYGGEEFVVVLSKTNAEGAAIIGERIREHIDSLQTCIETQNIHATVSVGVSSLHGKEHVKELFERADKALYQAKHQGRNRVVIQD